MKYLGLRIFFFFSYKILISLSVIYLSLAGREPTNILYVAVKSPTEETDLQIAAKLQLFSQVHYRINLCLMVTNPDAFFKLVNIES